MEKMFERAGMGRRALTEIKELAKISASMEMRNKNRL